MVGKASTLDKGGGIRIEKVTEWERQVNIYEQKDLINGQCKFTNIKPTAGTTL